MAFCTVAAVIWAQYQMMMALKSELPLADRSEQVCFYAEMPVDEAMTCHLGAAGVYPPLSAPYTGVGCCFDAFDGSGVFWALGEQHMSLAQNVELKAESEPILRRNTEQVPAFVWNLMHRVRRMIWGGTRVKFALKEAVLVDLLALDETDDAPVSGVRVSVSDASMHLVSYVRSTDADGYAVLPMVSGASYVVSMRASGFVQPEAMHLIAPADDAEEVEKVVVLSHGVTLSGTVTNGSGIPVSGAQLVVSVTNGSGLEVWNSTLDRPKAMSQTVTTHTDAPSWVPERPSVTCDQKGRFRIENVPQGQIQIYAVATGFVPHGVVKLDAREENAFDDLKLSVGESHSAWVRVTNSDEVTVAAALDIIDIDTGYAFDTVKLGAASSTKVTGLPKQFEVTVRADGCWPQRKRIDLTQGDELSFVLESAASARLRGRVVNAEGEGIAGVSLVSSSNYFGSCMGRTNKSGGFELEDCPSNGTELQVEAVDYAPKAVMVKPDHENVIVLDHGVSLQLKVPQDEMVCSVRRAQKNAPVLYRQLPTQHTIVFSNLERAEYLVECTADGYVPTTLKWKPTGSATMFEESISLQAWMEVSGVVLEKYSADASYAMVEVNGVRAECDEQGRFYVQVAQSDKIIVRAQHWLYGQAEVTREATDKTEFVVRLDDEPPHGCAAFLQEHHVQTVLDGASLLIDAVGKESKWSGRGLKRGDYVESCNKKLVIVRDNKRIEFK